MERVILHSDLNNFYASVECLYNPQLRDKPVAVCGDTENRHGIVLAKNQLAKRFQIQTGEAVWQARQKCPGLVVVPPHYDRYLRYSRLAKEIYTEYTDQVESFGLDECWLDVTGSVGLYGSGRAIAGEIREKIKAQMGITASVGVSFNKIFAKLGSDLKKPDATTEIPYAGFRELVWPLPVQELLYVGKATGQKLGKYGIETIGDLANTDTVFLKRRFGKTGLMLWQFANGLDNSPVSGIGSGPPVKSIGNSTTAPRDLVTEEEIKIILYVLSESVAERLRAHGFYCWTVQVSFRDKDLFCYGRQKKLSRPTCLASEIFDAAFSLAREHRGAKPIRSIGVRACGLIVPDAVQLSFYTEEKKRRNLEMLELAVDGVRRRFGHFSVQRGVMLTDAGLSRLDPKGEHAIYPVAFLKG